MYDKIRQILRFFMDFLKGSLILALVLQQQRELQTTTVVRPIYGLSRILTQEVDIELPISLPRVSANLCPTCISTVLQSE